MYQQGKYSCNIGIGGSVAGQQYANGVFQFDLAWVHFFDYYINPAAVAKEANASWIFTDFPSSLNTYKTIGS